MADVWSGSTPEKLAVKTALLGGSTRGDAPPPLPPSSLKPRGAAAPSASPAAPPPPPPPASPGARRPGSAAASSLKSGSKSVSSLRSSMGDSALAEEIKRLDERRGAAAAAAAIRKSQGVIRRMAQESERELAQIGTMIRVAEVSRDSSLRVAEAKALKAAEARNKAARHERKVLSLRCKGAVETLMRQTLSMRIARSSRQQAAAGGMLKALAAQARLGAADQLKAAASERTAVLLNAQSRLAWLNHTAAMMNEAMLRETAAQVEQRQEATKQQREALARMMKDLRVEEDALLAKMQAEQAHAEASFQANLVEPLEDRKGEGEAFARARVADRTDTDADAAFVNTKARVAGKLGGLVAQRERSVAGAQRVLREGAADVGMMVAQAEALEDMAAQAMGREARTLAAE